MTGDTMAFSTKELKDKSEPELAAIADELGLQLNAESTGKNTFIMEILQAQEEDALAHAAEPPEVPEVPAGVIIPGGSNASLLKTKEKRIRIIVSNQEGVEQTPFVKVQVNGEMFAIPREIEVPVPDYVVEVLNNAVVTRLVQAGGEWVEQKAKRFPFTILGPAK